MKRILVSLALVGLVGSAATFATWAYFSSQTAITTNTFATGTLELRINGQPSVVGATFSPIAPGEIGNSPEYHINNFGAPFFAGPSNLTAKVVNMRIDHANDHSSGLWQEVMVSVEVNRGWPTWHEVYNGKIKDMGTVDLLAPRWTQLVPGDSEMMRYHVWLPETGGNQNMFMGKELSWDFVIEGRTN